MQFLFATVLIDLIGFGIVIPILPFLAPKLGASNLEIGLIIATYSIFNGLCGPFWGRMSDRFGRKPIILICLAGAVISYIGLAFASSLTAIYIWRAFGGWMAGNFGVASAMIADMTTPENRAKGMGMIGAAFGLGMVIGPTLGGLLSGNGESYMLPFLVAAGLSTTAIIAGFFLLEETMTADKRADHVVEQSKHEKASLFRMLKQTNNRILASIFTLHNTCVSMISFVFPLWVGKLLGWGAMEVGFVFGIQGLMMAFVQIKLLGPLSTRMGEIPFLIMSIGIMSSGFVVATLASTTPFILMSFFLTVTGSTLCLPILNSITSKRTPLRFRGQMLGTTSSMSAWGRVTGPLLGGVILHYTGFNIAWVAGAILGLIYLSWGFAQRAVPELSQDSSPAS
ncbi:MFS transporter [Oceanicoccus sp. KOV_DT_Chl]|uniref:MFS transporter n=1 Tax=Oceanicoccus sp. KOV_DT_Chl TaxID=1904639 RepID=UPI000C7B44DF|nr:MFS transporter [Oceanicoccus sp. KOV_DT_Chl]